MERFKLTSKGNLMWNVLDTVTGFSIDFREGLFNETQQVNNPENLTNELVMDAARIMREIGDYMGENHSELCMCDVDARKTALFSLCNERYWLALIDACKNFPVGCKTLEIELFEIMDDYVHNDNSVKLDYAEQTNLLGELSLLDEEEEDEVVRIVSSYIKNSDKLDLNSYVRDILWWPYFCMENEKR